MSEPMKYSQIGGGSLDEHMQRKFLRAHAIASQFNQPVDIKVNIRVFPPDPNNPQFGNHQYSIELKEPKMTSMRFVAALEGGIPVQDGVVGGQVHFLEDHSVGVFRTPCITDFCEYLGEGSSSVVFFSDSQITAYSDCGLYNRITEPIAVCSLNKSVWYNRFSSLINKPMEISEFDKALEPFSDDVSMYGLLTLIRNMNLDRVASYQRQWNPDTGAYSFAFALKDGGGQNMFSPPKEIMLKFRPYEYLDADISLYVRFQYDLRMNGSEAKVLCKLVSYTWQDEFRVWLDRILRGMLSKVTDTLYFGDMNIVYKTDEWKYKSAPVKFESK